jgi:predicted nucleotidyltransferase
MPAFKKRITGLLKANGYLVKTDPLATSGFSRKKAQVRPKRGSGNLKYKMPTVHFSGSVQKASEVFVSPAEKKIARALFVELNKPKVISLEDVYCNVTRMFKGVNVNYGGKTNRPVTNYNVTLVLKKLIREGFIEVKH